MRRVCLTGIAAICAVYGQQTASLPRPVDPAHPLISPDGSYALYGIPDAAQLWLENRTTHERRLVLDATIQTMTLAWSPDSVAFAVNDRWASDQEIAYIYTAATLDRLELRAPVLAADPQAARFVPGPGSAPHSYFHTIRWLDPENVELQLHGHTDGVREGNLVRPGECFDLRYRVSRGGKAHKVSQTVLPAGSQACAAID